MVLCIQFRQAGVHGPAGASALLHVVLADNRDRGGVSEVTHVLDVIQSSETAIHKTVPNVSL